MNALGFAWRSLVRQPARSTLGILGVAAVGALLFDMLLLSQGLIVSMRDLLDRTGFNIRVTTTGDFPAAGARLPNASSAAAAIAALPSVRSAIAVRLADARVERQGAPPVFSAFQGVSGGTLRPWTVLRGRDAGQAGEVVVNETLSEALQAEPGATIDVRASCLEGREALPPVRLVVAGVASFPFESSGGRTMGGALDTVEASCGGNGEDEADMILVIASDPVTAAAGIQALRSDLRTLTNEQMIGRLERGGVNYFRQISSVLTTVTVSFAMLLITVLLTVSVNQRLGEIAALRALGFSQRRVVADVLWESVLIVGTGGALSLPLGSLLASWLDRILRFMPGIPAELHFFVFEPDALVVHVSLLAATAVLAALYPMRIVARLPIAATLRSETIS